MTVTAVRDSVDETTRRDASGEMRWVRPALGLIVVAAFALYAWGLSANGNANTYYAAAVLSGTQSWKAFFFGALDSGSFITVDKPPMALWVMALSGRLFGFGTWSMLLPQAVAGAAAVAVLYATVRRAFGAVAGLVAATVLTLTPVTVAINRDNNPDPLLVLFLVLAAWAAQRAVTASGRSAAAWLALAAVFVGCGFNTKMLQAYLVVPALALTYLVAARAGLVRRVVHLLLAGVALAVSSFWWLAVVDLLPADSRPYVGGSTDNTVWDLVVGYNGLGRVFGGDGVQGGFGANFGGQPGTGRLFNDVVGGQISWLLPWAALSLVAGLILVWRRPRTDAARAGLVLWGGWLVVHFAVFSYSSGGFHPYYTTALAPGAAALTGAGVVLLAGAWRRSPIWAVVTAAGVAVTGGWSFLVLSRTPEWNPWLRWTVVAATVLAVLLLMVRVSGHAVLVAGVVTALVAGLAGPAAYSVSAAGSVVSGGNPLAGPSAREGFAGGRPPGMAANGPMPGRPPMAQRGNGGPPADGPPGDGRGAGPRSRIGTETIDYLRRNQGDARWLVAVASAQEASSLILQTREPVIAMGGFTGRDPAMTVERLQRLVSDGDLRFIIIGDGGRAAGSSEVSDWVKTHGTLIDASAQLYRLNP